MITQAVITSHSCAWLQLLARCLIIAQQDCSTLNALFASFLAASCFFVNLASASSLGLPIDEGMTNGPPIFAYLFFGPRRISLEWLLRPIKAAV
jgi:hypothetical protein